MPQQFLDSPAEHHGFSNYSESPGGISEHDHYDFLDTFESNNPFQDPFVDCTDPAWALLFETHRDSLKSSLGENEPTQPQTRPQLSPDTMSQAAADDGETTRKLQCPFRVAESALGRRLFSCRGVDAKSMAQVRRHLTRPANGRSHLPFVKLCPTCNDDFLDKNEFETRHGDKGLFCDNPRKQRKGAIAQQMQWDALYVKVKALVFAQAGTQELGIDPNINSSAGQSMTQSVSNGITVGGFSASHGADTHLENQLTGPPQTASNKDHRELAIGGRCIFDEEMHDVDASDELNEFHQRDADPYYNLSRYGASSQISTGDLQSTNTTHQISSFPAPILLPYPPASSPWSLLNVSLYSTTRVAPSPRNAYSDDMLTVTSQASTSQDVRSQAFTSQAATTEAASSQAAQYTSAISITPASRNRSQHALQQHRTPQSLPTSSDSSLRSTASMALTTTSQSERTTASCMACDAEFTGRYAQGNLARHVRHKHGHGMEIKLCRICKKVYNRADARRKHEWKKHRVPDARPHKRRKEG